MFEGLMGLHVLHDACHASITHRPGVWKWVGSTFDLFVGASYFAWIHQHVLGHHLYTNVRGADPDLGDADVDFRRISPHQKWLWFHRYQHIYAPLLYGLLSFKYRMQDFSTFFSRINGRIRVVNIPIFYVVMFVLGKALFIVARLIIPLFFMPLTHFLVVFIVAELVLGYYLSVNFQVSHIAPDLDFFNTPVPPTKQRDIQDDWAISQVRTTQDYGHGRFFTAFFAGALNYQVVHHLFPSISQTYYPEIAPIVVKTCKEFGVHYVVLPDFWSAISSHVGYLKKMGCPPEDDVTKKVD